MTGLYVMFHSLVTHKMKLKNNNFNTYEVIFNHFRCVYSKFKNIFKKLCNFIYNIISLIYNYSYLKFEILIRDGYSPASIVTLLL